MREDERDHRCRGWKDVYREARLVRLSGDGSARYAGVCICDGWWDVLNWHAPAHAEYQRESERRGVCKGWVGCVVWMGGHWGSTSKESVKGIANVGCMDFGKSRKGRCDVFRGWYWIQGERELTSMSKSSLSHMSVIAIRLSYVADVGCDNSTYWQDTSYASGRGRWDTRHADEHYLSYTNFWAQNLHRTVKNYTYSSAMVLKFVFPSRLGQQQYCFKIQRCMNSVARK